MAPEACGVSRGTDGRELVAEQFWKVHADGTIAELGSREEFEANGTAAEVPAIAIDVQAHEFAHFVELGRSEQWVMLYDFGRGFLLRLMVDKAIILPRPLTDPAGGNPSTTLDWSLCQNGAWDSR